MKIVICPFFKVILPLFFIIIRLNTIIFKFDHSKTPNLYKCPEINKKCREVTGLRRLLGDCEESPPTINGCCRASAGSEMDGNRTETRPLYKYTMMDAKQ